MTDMILRGLPDELHDAICRRADRNGMTPEVEAETILQDAIFHEQLQKALSEQGLGSALALIGREFGITHEFDSLRESEPPGAALFE